MFDIFIRSIFIDNMVFAYFLGMCSYLAVSKNVKTAFGLGLAVCFGLLLGHVLLSGRLQEREDRLRVGTGRLLRADRHRARQLLDRQIPAPRGGVDVAERELRRHGPLVPVADHLHRGNCGHRAAAGNGLRAVSARAVYDVGHLPAVDCRELCHPRRLALHAGASLPHRGAQSGLRARLRHRLAAGHHRLRRHPRAPQIRENPAQTAGQRHRLHHHRTAGHGVYGVPGDVIR